MDHPLFRLVFGAQLNERGIIAAIGDLPRCSVQTPVRMFKTDVFRPHQKSGGGIVLVIRSDILMVNYFLGTEATGIYSISANMADIFYMVPSSIGMILYPQVSAMMEGGWVYSRQVAKGTAIIMCIFCILAALIIRPFIYFFYGPVFIGAADALLWLLPGIFALSVNMIFMNFMAARGMPLIVVISPFVALLVNVILNLYFIPHFGINGAAMTSSIAYSIMLMISLLYLSRNRNIKEN